MGEAGSYCLPERPNRSYGAVRWPRVVPPSPAGKGRPGWEQSRPAFPVRPRLKKTNRERTVLTPPRGGVRNRRQDRLPPIRRTAHRDFRISLYERRYFVSSSAMSCRIGEPGRVRNRPLLADVFLLRPADALLVRRWQRRQVRSEVLPEFSLGPPAICRTSGISPDEPESRLSESVFRVL